MLSIGYTQLFASNHVGACAMINFELAEKQSLPHITEFSTMMPATHHQFDILTRCRKLYLRRQG
jgi:hypothetical protein